MKTNQHSNLSLLKKTRNVLAKTSQWKALFAPLFILFSMSFATLAHAQGPAFQWAKAQGGLGWDNGYAITVDNNGNAYTTGLYRADADFDPGVGTFTLTANGTSGNNLYVSKLNAQGDFVWAKKFGSTKLNYAYSIAHDAASNIYVTGYFYDSLDFDPGPNEFFLHSTVSKTTSDAFILKLDSAGNFLWAKNIGGASNDQAYSVAVDGSNNVIITGKFFGTTDFDPGPGVFSITPITNSANAFILKLNSAGNFVWAKNMGPATNLAPITTTGTGFSIAVDKADNIYSTGFFRDTIDFDPSSGQTPLVSNGLDDIYVLKLNSAGNFVWARSIGSSRADQGLSIALDSASNLYITGIFNDTVDFDPSINVYNLSTTNDDNSNIFILKMDSTGKFSWAKSIEGVSSSAFENNFSFSINVDRAGNSYTMGYMFGTADFDPGQGTSNVNSLGLSDIFILKLNPNGNFKWVRKMGGPDIDVTRSGAVDATGNVYLTGWFKGLTDFDPGVGIAELTSNPITQPDIMVIKFACGDTTSSSLIDSGDCSGYILNGTTYLNSGTYVQTISNIEGCDSTITLHLTIVPIVSINIFRNSNVLSTVETFSSYQWMLNGQLITGATNSNYTITQNGDYRVIVTNANGCMDTSSIFTVSDFTGLDDLAEIARLIKIYPNPTTDIVNIQSPISVNVDVTGIEGRKIMSIKNAKNFSIKSLATGIYLLRVSDKNGVWIQTVKVVKQ